MKTLVLTLCFSLFSAVYLSAQWYSNFQENFSPVAGLHLEYGLNVNGGSYLNFSISAAVRKHFYRDWNIENERSFRNFIKENTFGAYQVSLNMYYNSLGDHYIDDLRKVNLDFVHGFMLGVGELPSKDVIRDYKVNISSLHSYLPAIVVDSFMHSLVIGTNFILNNNNRNQRVGFLNVNMARVVVLNYYNDGPPYDGWLGDGFDRWWTGGGGLDVYLDQYIRTPDNSSFYASYFRDSRISIKYDRFTGNMQGPFESSTLFGFHYVPAKNLDQLLLNQSRLKIGMHFFQQNFEMGYVRHGNILDDLQNFIHLSKGDPLHYTYSRSRDIFFANYSPKIQL